MKKGNKTKPSAKLGISEMTVQGAMAISNRNLRDIRQEYKKQTEQMTALTAMVVDVGNTLERIERRLMLLEERLEPGVGVQKLEGAPPEAEPAEREKSMWPQSSPTPKDG